MPRGKASESFLGQSASVTVTMSLIIFGLVLFLYRKPIRARLGI